MSADGGFWCCVNEEKEWERMIRTRLESVCFENFTNFVQKVLTITCQVHTYVLFFHKHGDTKTNL
jgi:hypothetical protein